MNNVETDTEIHFCEDCEHRDFTHLCYHKPKEYTNYVNGVNYIEGEECEDINTDGHCEYFEPRKKLSKGTCWFIAITIGIFISTVVYIVYILNN